MTVHVVSISKEAFAEVFAAMPPFQRKVWLGDEVPQPNFWLYGDNGEVVLFTSAQIEKRECYRLTVKAVLL